MKHKVISVNILCHEGKQYKAREIEELNTLFANPTKNPFSIVFLMAKL